MQKIAKDKNTICYLFILDNMVLGELFQGVWNTNQSEKGNEGIGFAGLAPAGAEPRAGAARGGATAGSVLRWTHTFPSFEERSKRATRNWQKRAERLL